MPHARIVQATKKEAGIADGYQAESITTAFRDNS